MVHRRGVLCFAGKGLNQLELLLASNRMHRDHLYAFIVCVFVMITRC